MRHQREQKVISHLELVKWVPSPTLDSSDFVSVQPQDSRKADVMTPPCNPRTQEVEVRGSEVQSQPQLHMKFSTTLGYMSPSSEEKKLLETVVGLVHLRNPTRVYVRHNLQGLKILTAIQRLCSGVVFAYPRVY